MMFKAHATYGAVVSLFFTTGSYVLTENIETSLMTGTACFIGSLFPDLDVDSIPSRWAARIGFIASIALVYFQMALYAAIIGIAFMGLKSGKHRGFTHKYGLALLMFLAPVFINSVFPNLRFVPLLIWWGFGIGLITHYACDSMKPWVFRNWV